LDAFSKAPDVNTGALEFNITAPEVNTRASEFNTGALESNITAPDVNITAPEVNTGAFESNITAPDVNITAPDINTCYSVIKFPKIEKPVLYITTSLQNRLTFIDHA